LKIIGHRGAAGLAPENTLEAIRRGLELNVHGIEIDVQLTKDRQVVVIHDFTVDRTSDGSGEVDRLTLEELRRLDFGAKFHPSFKGERIPTLMEVLQTVPTDRLLNVELKQIAYRRRGLEEEVAKVIRHFGQHHHIIVSSFDHRGLKTIKELLPEIRIGLLTYHYPVNPRSYLEGLGFPVYSLHPAFELVDREDVKTYLDMGLEVLSYTVNDPQTARELESMGVSGIFSDRPDLFV
jgi:glycerophosphoryl diester phosphodiesterase